MWSRTHAIKVNDRITGKDNWQELRRQIKMISPSHGGLTQFWLCSVSRLISSPFQAAERRKVQACLPDHLAIPYLPGRDEFEEIGLVGHAEDELVECSFLVEHCQPSRLNRYSHIMHDLAVQRAVLKRLDHYDEVIWDKHITLPDHDEKPDALLHSPKDYWVALDYERWRQEHKRIYLSFLNHARAFIKRHYSGVYYLFDREPDLVHYQTLFAAQEWPEYTYNRKTGKITPTGTHFKPDAIEHFRDCFLFIHEPHTHTRDSP